MSPRCARALDSLEPTEALVEHAARCAECAATLAHRQRARDAWRWAMHRDDVTTRALREGRIFRGSVVKRASAGRVVRAAFVLSAVFVALIAAWVARQRGGIMDGGVTGVALREVRGASPAATRPAPEPDSPPVARATPGLRIVEVRGTASSASGRALVSGQALAVGEAVQVAAGSVLRICWALAVDEDVDGAVASELWVTGPADGSIGGDGTSPAFVLRRGAAAVVATGAAAVVEAPGLRTRGEHARWQLSVHGGVARVAATEGHVAVTTPGEAQGRDLAAGQQVSVDAQGHAIATPRQAVRADETDALWQAAEEDLAFGRRAEAETRFRALVAQSVEPGRRSRAALRLGELLLARGALDEARGRLEPLAFGGDRGAAGDAMWLYVRTLPSARTRADAWARFLSTSPPSPTRELATVEQASALLDAGDVAGARRIRSTLADGSLPPVARDAARRLSARLDAAP